LNRVKSGPATVWILSVVPGPPVPTNKVNPPEKPSLIWWLPLYISYVPAAIPGALNVSCVAESTDSTSHITPAADITASPPLILYPLGLVALLRKSCPASVNVVATPEVLVPLVIIPG